jgi:hypothetical protein
LIASLIGFVITVWLLPGKQSIGKLHLDVDTLVYALGLLLIGVHSMMFAACGKIYAMSTGLLPPDPKFQKNFNYFTLERGLIVSSLLLLGGLSTAILSVVLWLRASLGDLDPVRMLRITLPSVTAILLGFELAIVSFFLSLLGMPKRTGPSNL